MLSLFKYILKRLHAALYWRYKRLFPVRNTRGQRKQVISNVKPIYADWDKASSFEDSWKERISLISSHIGPVDSVLDIGCGMMWLRTFLDPATIYYGCDLYQRDEQTIVCNFNNYEFPCNIQTDCAVISGVAEYIYDWQWLLRSTLSVTKRIIFSYCTRDNYPDLDSRKQLGWVNSISHAEILAYMKELGTELESTEVMSDGTTIYIYTHKQLLSYVKESKMKRIVLLDTWVNDSNIGNKIIMESAYKQIREIFPKDIIYHLPALEYINKGRIIANDSDYIFLAGTNLLSANMDKTSEWCVTPKDSTWLKNVILFGVGWWQYQTEEINQYSKQLLHTVLHKEILHSVRDSYTVNRINEISIRAVNTGCPTTWALTPMHCDDIPKSKANNVIFTYTEYHQNPFYDRVLFEILHSSYNNIYFWTQQYGDYLYAKSICGNQVRYIEPALDALDSILSELDIDYIGTRLHAGIRSLQHKRRTIILTVDNRAKEIGLDINLPIIDRECISTGLMHKISSEWPTEIKINTGNIQNWKDQFTS